MAKRRVTPPTAEELAAMDAAFRDETVARPNPAAAPIAQVAADTATSETAADRFDRVDAETLRDAKEKGLLVQEIPLDQIDVENIVRDRSVINQSEQIELAQSIKTSGQRLPIEVYQTDAGYALISGYRRFMAVLHLAQSHPDDYAKIKAFVRPLSDTAELFAAMVEENEIRASLSHFERGRIAVIASEQGAFDSIEGAVNQLFRHASKAKRSKVRSFAELFECLGDLMSFAEDLTERRGLRLAGAIRQGAENELRTALGTGQGTTAEEEWALLEPIVEATESAPRRIARPGRKKSAPSMTGWTGRDTVRLSSGVTLTKGHDGRAHFIRISGKGVNSDILESALQHLQYVLDKPD